MVNPFDFVVRINNAIRLRKQEVIVLESKLSFFFLNFLLKEGYIVSYKLVSKGRICVYLKYDMCGTSCIKNILISDFRECNSNGKYKCFYNDDFLSLNLYKGSLQKIIKVF